MDIEEFLFITLGEDRSGHGVDHAHRVLDNAHKIMESVEVDRGYVEGCCLLHDCLDSKLGLDNDVQESKIVGLLIENGFTEEKSKAMVDSMKRMSFHLHDESSLKIEDMVIRDADRLDAIGEIGYQRALAYGEAHNRPFLTEEDRLSLSKGEVPHSKSTLSHFFDKLLILDEHLYLDISKKMAVALLEEMKSLLIDRLREEGIAYTLDELDNLVERRKK